MDVDVDLQEDLDAAAGDAVPHVDQGRGLGPHESPRPGAGFDLNTFKTNPPKFSWNSPGMRRTTFYGETSLILAPNTTDVRRH